MQDTDLFQLALGLSSPWTVTRSAFDAVDGRLDLYVDFPRGSRFACAQCGRDGCAVHDTKEETWRHLDFFQHRTLLHARTPRVTCPECGVRKVATGALIGGAIASQNQGYYPAETYPVYSDPGYGYDYAAPTVYNNGGSVAYCEQTYRSYDPASRTYLGYDGFRHPCPQSAVSGSVQRCRATVKTMMYKRRTLAPTTAESGGNFHSRIGQ